MVLSCHSILLILLLCREEGKQWPYLGAAILNVRDVISSKCGENMARFYGFTHSEHPNEIMNASVRIPKVRAKKQNTHARTHAHARTYTHPASSNKEGTKTKTVNHVLSTRYDVTSLSTPRGNRIEKNQTTRNYS